MRKERCGRFVRGAVRGSADPRLVSWKISTLGKGWVYPTNGNEGPPVSEDKTAAAILLATEG